MTTETKPSLLKKLFKKGSCCSCSCDSIIEEVPPQKDEPCCATKEADKKQPQKKQ